MDELTIIELFCCVDDFCHRFQQMCSDNVFNTLNEKFVKEFLEHLLAKF